MSMGSKISRARMADITEKSAIYREAIAMGKIRLRPETIRRIKEKKTVKGDPFHVAEVAAVMAAKKTPQIIPFCHPLLITDIEAQATLNADSISVKVKVKTTGKTGVEMEALTATTAYLLTIWDMVKSHEKDERGQYPTTVIEWIRVERKKKRT